MNVHDVQRPLGVSGAHVHSPHSIQNITHITMHNIPNQETWRRTYTPLLMSYQPLKSSCLVALCRGIALCPSLLSTFLSNKDHWSLDHTELSTVMAAIRRGSEPWRTRLVATNSDLSHGLLQLPSIPTWNISGHKLHSFGRGHQREGVSTTFAGTWAAFVSGDLNIQLHNDITQI